MIRSACGAWKKSFAKGSDDLLQSLKEAGAIARKEAPASRRFKIVPPDVRAVREQIGLSQSEFACLMQVSVRTLQSWEQHRRNPTGPALALKTLHV
ncbi:MAG: helix-turn-helix domain-containing protein [Zoogloeaceae bacterium]|jgi:putative transcriptional regulator|nr:helix-turn-helix domain-containing protein [Zoogloeaceae bacterium]